MKKGVRVRFIMLLQPMFAPQKLLKLRRPTPVNKRAHRPERTAGTVVGPTDDPPSEGIDLQQERRVIRASDRTIIVVFPERVVGDLEKALRPLPRLLRIRLGAQKSSHSLVRGSE